jgi:two-component sensor histidine kinase
VGGIRFTLPRDVRSVRKARLRVRAIDDLPEPVVTDTELVVSELVTNSLLHAGLGDQDVIEVALQRDDVRLIIVVDDRDGFFGTSGVHGAPRRPGGMGLKLLDAVCEHWHAEAGRVVASLTI